MNREELLKIAEAVLANGKPASRSEVDEGTVESGPVGYRYAIVRWGQLSLEVVPNGSCYLVRDTDRGGYGYPDLWVCVYGTGSGSGHWGGRGEDFWRDEERESVRDRVREIAGREEVRR